MSSSRLLRRVWFLLVLGTTLPMMPAGLSRAGEGPLEAVLKLEEQRFAAMVAGDLVSLDRMLGDGLTYVHSTGRLETKPEFLARIKSGELKYKSVRREDLSVQVLDRAAVVTGQAVMEVESKGAGMNMHVRYTAVYADGGDHWELVAWQSTQIQ